MTQSVPSNKVLVLISLLCGTAAHAAPCQTNAKFTAVLHGGAGDWQIAAAAEPPYREQMRAVLSGMRDQLQKGAAAVDVVQAALVQMEDSGLFDAGLGSVATNKGGHELDAAIMDGKTLKGGGVGVVTTIKNPILAARLVMDQTNHVLLAGPGAEAFAKDKGLAVVDEAYYQRKPEQKPMPGDPEHKHGTVGAVALDRCGNLAAATSTGGLPGKLPGRIGDTPLLGAGTYADNRTAAVSATGYGEYLMRFNVTITVSDLMRYKKLGLKAAADEAIHGDMAKAGGTGGVIAVDRSGQTYATYNTKGMLHGSVHQTGPIAISFH